MARPPRLAWMALFNVRMKKENEMKDLWINRLKIASRKLLDKDSPEWWDGFHNVVARNETSHDDDNPYVKYHEDAPYKAYRAGAMAGESLLRTLKHPS
jgi:hypothetical protein